ncbi:MAG: hypothetical protein IKH44_10510 [Bacteroidales bacterium]|nr:hypothetical protein [Bacteroidales bacterium]
MKTYKWLRGLMKASALTTVMFVMQACYGSPNMPPEMPDDRELTETDTIVSVDEPIFEELTSAEAGDEDVRTE